MPLISQFKSGQSVRVNCGTENMPKWKSGIVFKREGNTLVIKVQYPTQMIIKKLLQKELISSKIRT